MQFQPDMAPVGGSLALSALVALLPLLTVFVCLGLFKWKAQWACLLGAGVALVVAIAFYRMPVGMAVSSFTEGAAFGIFPITWIVLAAIFLFELTVSSGHHDDLMRTFTMISGDPRVLGVLIAFSFCALLEALAGFGAPVAIVGVMLVAIGFTPMKAALTVLVGNTFAVPFGAIATPIITGGRLTDIPYQEIGSVVARQTTPIAWAVPLLLLVIMDGRRGLKQVWPLGLVVGLVYSVTTLLSADYLSVELTNMVAALVSLAAGVLMLRVWHPAGSAEAAERLTGARPDARSQSAGADAGASQVEAEERISGTRIVWALFPYLLIIAVFVITQMVPPVKSWLSSTDLKIHWPALWNDDAPLVLTASGEPSSSALYTFSWLSSPGTLLVLTAIVIGLVFRMSPKDIARVFTAQVYKLRWTFVTIASVLGLAYVMNLSGQTLTIGYWIAGAGVVFAFLSPILGWIGTAVTGSGTSATALFASLQQTAADGIGVDPRLLVAANTVGGAVGKMIAPQTLTIAATAVDGKESDMLRKAMPWSIGLLVVLCLLVGLQSTPVLGWMIP